MTPKQFLAANASFRDETRVLNGTRMHYLVGGSGPMIVLLHGWPQNWFEWRHVMPDLAKEYTVVVPDLPGL
jgi:pimeloyl-ACP methyl ester carboxylesterase